jgi:hypothetical protein
MLTVWLWSHTATVFALRLPGIALTGDRVARDELDRSMALVAVLAPLLLAAYFALYMRYVKRAPPSTPQFLHEPPADLSPAMVGMLFSPEPTADKMAGTLLDLVDRGVVEMRVAALTGSRTGDPAGGDDRVFHLHRERLGELSLGERDLVYEVFDHISGGATDVSLGDVRRWWDGHPATAGAILGYWGIQMRREAEALGLMWQGDPGRRTLSFFGQAVLIGCGVTVVTVGIGGFLLIPLGVFMLALAQRVVNLTDRGFTLSFGYQAFRRYLEEFGRMDEKPAEAVVLWKRYLSLAVVLGLATESVDDLYIQPPSYAEYGRAGRRSRRLITTTRRSFPDEAEAIDYGLVRIGYDPTLPPVKIVHGRSGAYVTLKTGFTVTPAAITPPTTTHAPGSAFRLFFEFLPLIGFALLPVVIALFTAD